MKLLCLSDLHDRSSALSSILEDAGAADLLLMGGDLTNFGSPDQAEALIRQAGALGCPVLAVAGNCDTPAIDRRMHELGVGLHGRGVRCGEIGVQGMSAIPPWRPGMYQLTEEDLADALRRGHADIAGTARRVVLAHVPPSNARLDRTVLRQHVGSQALREFVDQFEPDLVVCGHVHEARGVERLGTTTVVNCGPAAQGCYAMAELGDNGVAVELRQADV